jgi:LysR family glycine cleavage system transcriptional activator
VARAAPRSLHVKHAEIDLELDPTNRLVDFGTEKVDLGIRYGDGAWPDVTAIKLTDSEFTPVCSPALLKKSKVHSPRDLVHVTLLQEHVKENWRDWLEAAGVADLVSPAGPVLKGHLVIAAAEAGQGFALADAIQVGDALLAKRLVRPFDIVVRHHAYYLVRRAGSKEGKAAAAFRAWLEAEIASAALELRALNSERPPGQQEGTSDEQPVSGAGRAKARKF